MDDVLDPTIVRFTPKIGTTHIGGRHENFPPRRASQRAFEVDMVDLDSIEERSRFQVVLKEPGEVVQDPELWKQLQQKAPQFSLRNVIRHVMEHHFPHMPWLTEVWRDAQEYAVTFGGKDVLTYEPADLEVSDLARRIMRDERADNRAVIRDLDWHDYHGRWKEGLTAHSWYAQHGLLQHRSKGRFAETDDDQPVVTKPADAGFDASQGQGRPAPKAAEESAEIDPRFEGLPDEIKKMLGLI